MMESNKKEGNGFMRAILSVKEKIYLTPHYIRMILEGEDLSIFSEARVGDNNKIIVPQNNMPIDLLHFERSALRTYTLRNLDLQKNLMTVDFVGHGENGLASKWATHAQPGDELGVLMKVRNKALFLSADWYLLAGDHTALPVISVILESLPNDAKGKVILEVHSVEDVMDLQKPEGIEIIWKFNNQPGTTSTLLAYFKPLLFSNSGSKFIFAAAESVAISEIQQILRDTSGLRREEWQAFSYWKYGQAEGSNLKKK